LQIQKLCLYLQQNYQLTNYIIMRKNYFKNNLVTASMLLAVSMGMASCSGFIDAVLGTEDKPVSQPTTQPEQPKATVVTVTAEGAKVEASNASEVSKALGNLVDDIKAKGVGEGKEYKVEVSGVSSESTASENTIVVPKVENSNINLVFTEAVATSSAPLVVKASETTSTESKAAVNELTITVPNAESLDLKVDMPETTVTLKSSGSNSVIKSIVAKTALNTLIIESGVTVEELEVQGGRVIVKSGGKIETYVYPASEGFIRISSDGVIPYRIAGIDQSGNEDWDNPVWQIADEQNNPYYIQNLKIIKGQAEYATIEHEIEVNRLFKKLIIADGAAVNYKNGEDIRIETIEGQGNAKFLYGVSYENYSTGDMVYTGGCDLRYVKNLNGVAFIPLWEDKVGDNTHISNIRTNTQDCSFKAYGIDMVGSGVENCVFNFNKMHIEREKYANSHTLKNCKFEKNSMDERWVSIYSRTPTDDVTSFKELFDNCEFAAGTSFDCYQDCGELQEVTVYVWSQIIDGAIFPGGKSTNFDDVPEYNKNIGETNGRYDDSKNPDTEHQGMSMGYWKETINTFVSPVEDFNYTVSFSNCKYAGNDINTSNLVDSFFGPIDGIGLNFFVEINGRKYKASYGFDDATQKKFLNLTPVS
jgi:hypothetical protein